MEVRGERSSYGITRALHDHARVYPSIKRLFSLPFLSYTDFILTIKLTLHHERNNQQYIQRLLLPVLSSD